MAADSVLSVIQHALGVDQFGQGQQYRNYFVCGEGHHSYVVCCDAVGRGLMTRHERQMFGDNGSCFVVTAAGRTWMAEASPRPPRLTRGQRRYRRYLDAGCSMSFGQWLRHDRSDPFTAHCAADAGFAAVPDTEIPF